jgi:hypothetical protein
LIGQEVLQQLGANKPSRLAHVRASIQRTSKRREQGEDRNSLTGNGAGRARHGRKAAGSSVHGSAKGDATTTPRRTDRPVVLTQVGRRPLPKGWAVAGRPAPVTLRKRPCQSQRGQEYHIWRGPHRARKGWRHEVVGVHLSLCRNWVGAPYLLQDCKLQLEL